MAFWSLNASKWSNCMTMIQGKSVPSGCDNDRVGAAESEKTSGYVRYPNRGGNKNNPHDRLGNEGIDYEVDSHGGDITIRRRGMQHYKIADVYQSVFLTRSFNFRYNIADF
eukprot:CAMPEP_0172380202 /NCGR_PEP_ID=MMETSP1060-20121228/70319_1 /TAXON_ID=37318 /ORGANISM="Pseudo-nitzschia pungens, Strain cf. cingulata" /LENGTH=110 /DNA_ID=CAMNT_0013107953 /DNA_START=43 /DNA_END=376 /DNA_ORIENTATION=-